MIKINNKTTFLNLFILAILAVGLIVVPAKANAQRLGGYVVTSGQFYQEPAPTYYYPQPQPVYVPTYVPEPTPVYAAPAPTPTIYSNSTNPNPPIAKVTKIVAKSAPKPEKTNSELTAAAVFGEDTFLPSGLIQWILFAILILLIVILVRKIYGGSEKYNAVPMKHD